MFKLLNFNVILQSKIGINYNSAKKKDVFALEMLFTLHHKLA